MISLPPGVYHRFTHDTKVTEQIGTVTYIRTFASDSAVLLSTLCAEGLHKMKFKHTQSLNNFCVTNHNIISKKVGHPEQAEYLCDV